MGRLKQKGVPLEKIAVDILYYTTLFNTTKDRKKKKKFFFRAIQYKVF